MVEDVRAATTIAGLVCALAWSPPQLAADSGQTPDLALAERFVDAFYGFDPQPIADMLSSAGASQQDILFYQGWAQGGHYIVVNRMPCKAVSASQVSCSITVQDDLVLALGIDFDVTDTFTLSFQGSSIASVETSSNDPQLYHDARDWVWENRKALVRAPCRGTENVEPDPFECVRNMLQGYREYARLNGLEPRQPGQAIP
jgi:hypothetical protein